MKTKLFIDFDGTVFSTSKFRGHLFDVFKKSGFSEDEIRSTYQAEYLDYKYSPSGNFQRLKKIHGFDLTVALKRLNKLYERIPEFVFSDAIVFLNSINRDIYSPILFTLGDVDFQKTKVTKSGLLQYFDDVFYTGIQKWDYLKEIVEEDEKFIIIDDRGDALAKIAKRFKRSFQIEINRTEEPADSLEVQGEFNGIEIRNLKQALKYL